MVLKCAALQKTVHSVAEIAHLSRDRGQRSIYVASDLLADEQAASAAAAGAGEIPPPGSRETP
jgi:hypothetical protein